MEIRNNIYKFYIFPINHIITNIALTAYTKGIPESSPLEFASNAKKQKNKTKWLVSNIITILLVIIIINLYLVSNIILSKVTLPEFDLTEHKVYSLSEETKSKLKNLENEVKITLINYEDTDSVEKLAEKYIVFNSKIKIYTINNVFNTYYHIIISYFS